ncbi:MAG: 1-(5-phosphoribosyl)-5-[(5-phosphoribosylamino)methylideneamino]imidazole-4-carboxamide isomerase [Bacteroidales bacterium]|jgi:phosphoribosylformimino-5-aminoimidazole carboxamide ribotide isomerase|nr:1-(5-phosphoribosyl)-5-[(5-phosphoribosylamino)methylideneamino]imidazole-4-carboxamide isomerase [Bacteroidales bacterium]
MIEVIPAIDLIDGKCVRLAQGDYSRKTVYSENPVEVAKRFAAAGIRRLHLVDLDGAKAQHIVNHRVLYDIARQTPLCIDFGGGLKTDNDLRIAFENGAAMVTGGSIAVKEAETFTRWITAHGPEKILLGADTRDRKIAVNGWTETADLELIPFIRFYHDRGIRQVVCTDISRDGMLQGPALSLYRQLLEHFPGLYVIASGGVASTADILALQEAGVPAVITGKALYEGKINLKELTRISGTGQ